MKPTPPTTARHIRPRRGALVALLVALAAALPLPAARGQDGEPPGASRQRRIDSLQSRAFEAIERADYPLAERILREQVELDPDNFVPHYNLACVLSLQSRAPEAVECLVRAVERGFVDLGYMQRDGQLAALRDEPQFKALVANWSTVLDRQLEANLAACRRMFAGGRYDVVRDEKLRLAYLTAGDPQSIAQARADITRLYEWGVANIFTDLRDPPRAGADPWVVVILPTPDDFRRWAVTEFGVDAIAGSSGIGGQYSHDSKRLVAMDLGATLRHEFFHVLHWRSCTRRGQGHPVWVQEGLCSLVEDYEASDGPDGPLIKPVPSWRTNITRRLARSSRLMPVKQLATLPRERFVGNRPLAYYAQARTLFLFLHDRGKLGDWYAAYTDGFREDPSGVAAMEKVFGIGVDELQAEYKEWVRALPEVAEQIRPGQASLGVEVDPGAGDGPKIVSIPGDSGGRAARAAGLRLGDVVTGIDGQATRDLNELVRVLGEHEVGDEVEVSYRRGREHGTVRVRLTRR